MKWPLVLLLLAGCGNDLPSASLIDKLRVLAVQAEPPEVAPAAPTTLRALVVEPLVYQLDGGAPPGFGSDAGAQAGVSYLWLSCAIPPGATEQAPCGLSPDVALPSDGGAPTVPPSCAADPGASFCVIGTNESERYAPPASTLGGSDTGQRLITLVVSDEPGGAEGCLVDAFLNGNKPTSPDHCVIALKRLVVSKAGRTLSDGKPAAPNRNPALTDLLLVENTDLGAAAPLDGGVFDVAPESSPPSFQLKADRADDAAEMEPQLDPATGKVTGYAYESLTVSWFTTGGKIDGGRSLFVPDGKDAAGNPCATQTDCPTTPPVGFVTTNWIAPNQMMLGTMAPPSGQVVLWAVIRDDRGGVSWLSGSARPK